LSYRFCEETDAECAGNSTANTTENNNAADDTERDPEPAQRPFRWLWLCVIWRRCHTILLLLIEWWLLWRDVFWPLGWWDVSRWWLQGVSVWLLCIGWWLR